MPCGYKPISSYGIIFFLTILCLFSGCSCEESPTTASIKADYCPEAYGCLNGSFVKLFEEKCLEKEKGCRFSFKDFFGDVGKVYFTSILTVWFDECSTLPVSELLKKTNTEMCQYILFEKDGTITSYIRSYCLSEVKLPKKDFISFNSNATGMVSVMDADEVVFMEKVPDGDKFFYNIRLDSSKLSKYQEDTCIHSP